MTLACPGPRKQRQARWLGALTIAAILMAGTAVWAAWPQSQSQPSPKPTTQTQTPAKPQRQTSQPAAKLPSPSKPDPSLISDFDDGRISATSGFGWMISTDSIMGGQSTADMKVVEGGANGTKGALQVTGKIAEGSPQAFAGVMYCPGPQPFTPVDLSSKKTLSFWAKGDGRGYAALVFTQAGGYMPAVQSFTTGPEWKEFRFPLSSFNGTDGKDVTAIMFSAGGQAGDFSFTIDTVRLE